MKSIRVLFISLVLSTILSACSSPEIEREAIAGTYSTKLTKQALTNSGAPFMIVTGFKDAEFIIEFAADGSYLVSEVADIGPRERLQGEFKLTEDEITFNDMTGEFNCTGKGRYNWSLVGDELTFSLVEDECEDRVYIYTVSPWMRQP